MTPEQNNTYLGSNSQSVAVARFMSRVYLWMTFGIALTGGISLYIANTPELLMSILQNRGIFYGVIFAELGAVIALQWLLPRISAFVASALFTVYAALTGITLSVIFYIYTRESIAEVFAVTGFAFAGLSGFGFVTKRDLGPVGSFCMMGLWGLIGWSLLAMFFPGMLGGSLSPTYSIIGLIVFSGLTAYDTQKIKGLSLMSQEGTDENRKGAIYGATILYLDFINLFLNLLRLMGRRK